MAIHHFKMKTKASLLVQWLSICLAMQEGFPGGASGKEPAMQQMWVRPLGLEDPLEEGMATQSTLLDWRIPLDRGAWRATVYRTAKSRTRLKQLSPLQCRRHRFYSWSGKTSHAVEQLSPSTLEQLSPSTLELTTSNH